MTETPKESQSEQRKLRAMQRANRAQEELKKIDHTDPLLLPWVYTKAGLEFQKKRGGWVEFCKQFACKTPQDNPELADMFMWNNYARAMERRIAELSATR